MPTAIVTVPGTTYRRGRWVDRWGHQHPSTEVSRDPYSKKVKRSHKRRSSKSKRFFRPKVHTGWRKDMPKGQRRALMLRAHEQDALATARALQALANTTQDRETRLAATEDAKYFYQMYTKEK